MIATVAVPSQSVLAGGLALALLAAVRSAWSP